MSKSKVPLTWLSHLLSRTRSLNPKPPKLYNQFNNFHSRPSPLKFNPIYPKPTIFFTQKRHFCEFTEEEEDRALQELLEAIEREKHLEREAKRKAGLVDVDNDDEEEDFMGVGPYIDKIDAELAKPYSYLDKCKDLDILEEPTDCDTEDEEEADRVLMEEERKQDLVFQRITKRHEQLITSVIDARTLDGAYRGMSKLDKFEDKHFRLLPEYRVIGELMNRFKEATGKDKFLLAQKLNRAIRLMERKEEFNPNDPTNYGIIERENTESGEADELGEEPVTEAQDEDSEEEEFDDLKEKDDILLEKVTAIDKTLEEKLAALDYTFGKKGKVLEEEIRVLAEERNALTEKKIKPMYRKGFEVKLIDVNRTCKVTKGGQVVKYTAILACGNFNGVVGYAKARGPAIPIAIQKAYEKCFQNLHYIDRYEDHTIAHAIQAKYKKTKIYLWPTRTVKGVVAGKTVEVILYLAGFKNIRSKVIGSRNPHNTLKALFMALNAIETPKDVQEKFGRTVVESHLVD